MNKKNKIMKKQELSLKRQFLFFIPLEPLLAGITVNISILNSPKSHLYQQIFFEKKYSKYHLFLKFHKRKKQNRQQQLFEIE